MALTPVARRLRHSMTDAERHLWRHLRLLALGVQFRRQVPIGNFIVDFACLRRRLVIEIDGGQHMESRKDEARDAWLRERGYRVLRFWNHEVLGNVEGVVAAIVAKLEGNRLA
ncbi:MAG: endonuclease domain-containing protein [Acidobacteriota bacterium]